MSQINIKVEDIMSQEVNPLDFENYLTVINRILTISAVVARLTPNLVDDKVVGTIQNVVDAVGPYVKEPWFSDLVNLIVGLFQKNKPEDVVKLLKAQLNA